MKSAKTLLTYFIASVWFINGLFCKVLNLVPRHQTIVARILGEHHAPMLTKTIGVLEVLMAVWVLSRIQSRLCTVTQIMLVLTMNLIEYFLAPDLLLFGRLNLLFATSFVLLIIWQDVLYRRPQSAATFKS